MQTKQPTSPISLPPILRHTKAHRLLASMAGGLMNLVFFLKDMFPLKPSSRTRVIILNEEASHILLVRNIAPPLTWKLPGGGCHRQENKYECAIRELKEELAITIQASSLQALPDSLSLEKSRQYFVTRIKQPSVQIKLSLELIDAAWYSLTDLPLRCSKETKNVIKWLLLNN